MTTTLYDQLERRILLLDGGFGTMVQGYGLQEEDYRGRRFAGWPVQGRAVLTIVGGREAYMDETMKTNK
mgnify:FL=1